MQSKPQVRIVPSIYSFRTRQVGIYCRVSTRSQEQLESLAVQISTLTRLVASKVQWHLADIYIDIKSGSDALERIEFQRMLADCRNKKLDIIVTKSISRFGRNLVEMLQALNELRSNLVEVIFEAERISTESQDSGLLISILEQHAQQESEERRKNIIWGMRRKAENGTSCLYARKCYGFTHNQDGELSINEAEAAVVSDIFDMYLQGKSVLGIQRELESRGIKTPTGKDKWSKRAIDTMLSNEKYSGDVIIFKTFSDGFPNTKRKINEPVKHTKYQSVGCHPAIISKEAFNAVQAEKARRSNVIKSADGAIRKSTRYSSLTRDRAHEQVGSGK